MRTILISLCMMVLMCLSVSAIANYGDYNYGAGEYGENTPPNITAYAPLTTTQTLNQSTVQSFNVTFIDYDGDTVNLTWYVNSTFNVSNQNLTYSFNNLGLFNVTAIVKDQYNDSNSQKWDITISVILTNANLTDILIVPKITTQGNLIIITANVTASQIDAQGVYAYLNVPYGFTFLTTQTPQNQSLGTVYTTNVTQVQWIVSTPLNPSTKNINVSYITADSSIQGNNEKIHVTNQEDFMSLAVIIGALVVIIIYAIAIRNFIVEIFVNRDIPNITVPSVRLGVIVLFCWLILIPISIATQINNFNGGPEGISNLMDVLYLAIVSLNIFITFYYSIWVGLNMLKKLETVRG